MLSPDRYFGTDQSLLIKRYIEVVANLASLHIENQTALVEERKTRSHAYYQSSEVSIAGKDRDADAASLDCWIAVQETKAQINELAEERDMLVHLIWGNHA